MLEKITKEYADKLNTHSTEELLKAPVYSMIISYLSKEYVSDEYKEMLKAKDNTLDYLYNTFVKTRKTHYEDVKNALDLDQLSA